MLKHTMDISAGNIPKKRVKLNSLFSAITTSGGVSRTADYYVCGFRHVNRHDSFDLVAVHWPSNPIICKKQNVRRLVLVKAKYETAPLIIRRLSIPIS